MKVLQGLYTISRTVGSPQVPGSTLWPPPGRFVTVKLDGYLNSRAVSSLLSGQRAKALIIKPACNLWSPLWDQCNPQGSWVVPGPSGPGSLQLHVADGVFSMFHEDGTWILTHALLYVPGHSCLGPVTVEPVPSPAPPGLLWWLNETIYTNS